MEKYYDKKTDILYDKFTELFKKALLDGNTAEKQLVQLAYMVGKKYPILKNQTNRVIYLFAEKENSEEKLEALLKLYKTISESNLWR